MSSSRSLSASVALAALLSVSASSVALAQGVEVVRSPKTGLVTWMTNSSGSSVSSAVAPGAGASSYEQAALSFLGQQSQAFGLRSGAAELTAEPAQEDGMGRGFVRVQQNYKGLPIIGAELVVQMDSSYSVMSVNGRSVGDVDVSTEPSVSAKNARLLAIEAAAGAHNVTVLELDGSKPVLSVHDARVMGGPAASPALVWRVEVTSAARPDIHQFVLIDAQNGRVAAQFNQIAHATAPANATQRICDAANLQNKLPCDVASAVKSPTTSKVVDVKSAHVFAEKAYDFFAKRFNRNSLDNKGLMLISTVRYREKTGEDLGNAYWSSALGQMIYGKGYAAAEDVVGHELMHGVTSFTSRLFYYYQSGALNESLSDIFGELSQRVDNKTDNWLLGEGLPIGAIRDMKDPTNPAYRHLNQQGQPDKMTSTLWNGDFLFQDAGAVHVNSGVGNKTAYLITDGGVFNGQVIKGIGIDKAAAIFWRVSTYHLTSSSDYGDLGVALKTACTNLQNTQPKDKSGKAGAAITSTDCKQVTAAVTATELAKQPQYHPIPAESPTCAVGLTSKTVVFEKFENDNSNQWSYTGSPSKNVFISNFYAASNTRAAVLQGPGEYIASLSSKAGVKLPSKAYLRFDHFHNFWRQFDNSPASGGVVEYNVSGKWVRVPASMFLNNPYNGTVANTGKFANQQAFVGFSGGWTSSRIDLSSLAGKTAKFRFRIGTDSGGASGGWFLDDIRVYTCYKK